MKYKLIPRGSPTYPEAPKKYYALPISEGRFTVRDLSTEIAARTLLSRDDIERVLASLAEVLPDVLQVGFSIKLGNFGTLWMKITSKGVENVDEFTAEHIKGVKVIFTPSPEMKKSLKTTPLELA